MLNFLSKFVYKTQLYLRPFYNILRQQNNFEWTAEHQTRFEEIKKLLTEQFSNTIPGPNQPFYGIGAALLQSHSGTNKTNLIKTRQLTTFPPPPTEKITLELLKQYQNLDPLIRQLKSWHKHETKPVKANTTILGNKTLLRYFRKINKTTINENTDLLEYQLNDSKVPCLPLSKTLTSKLIHALSQPQT